MYSVRKTFHLLTILLLMVCTTEVFSQDLSKKANTFLNTLSDELKAKAQFAMTDAERFNWNFVPIDRKGPTFHDFNEQQKKAAIDLLRSSLSEEGYQKAVNIMELESVLKVLENRKEDDPYRDPLNYHFSIFGTPGANNEWGWRFEGHHISLNFSSARGTIVSATPTFWGSNPGIVNSGPKKGTIVLKKEMEIGFQLINALNESQRKTAIFSSDAPSEIITGNNRKASLLQPKGIAYSQLNETQKKIFRDLLQVYIDNYTTKFSASLMDKIKKAGIDQLHFAWAGGLKVGTGHYYRIQSPVLLIEYDNVQNDANHIHTVIRDLTNDFGEDVLKNHYDHGHKHKH
jgi:hypothetical protein